MHTINTDVVVVGCGPVGATMANLLGLHGVRTVVIERERTEHGEPRAFSCDDEGLRIYQHAGLAERLQADMVECTYVDYAGVDGRPFAELHLEGLDFGSGYGAVNFFYQPKLERVLREGLQRFGHVAFRPGQEVTALRQDADYVTLTVRDRDHHTTHEIRARYVVGCDGARSTIRQLSGIKLVGASYEERWLAVSGFAPEQALRLRHTRYVCDPRRPTFVGRGAAGDYRMEFMLQPGESAAEMEDPAMIARLVEPYVDPAQLEITRAVVYKFHNVVAERWQTGRVLLAGDAAHQMPPMMGQGLVSGLRDAANLSWKLALVIWGAADPGILASYETERRPHAKEMADISANVAALFCTRRRSLALMRDGFFRTIQRIPRARRFIQNLEFKPAAVFKHGLIVGGRRRNRKAAEGTLFPQTRVIAPDGAAARLDDLLGTGFAVVGMHADPRLVVVQSDEVWTRLGTRLMQIVPAGQPMPPAVPGVSHVTDTTGKLAAWFQRHGAQLAVVRPDRYVFAAAPAAQAEHLASVVAHAFPPRIADDRPPTSGNNRAQGQPQPVEMSAD